MQVENGSSKTGTDSEMDSRSSDDAEEKLSRKKSKKGGSKDSKTQGKKLKKEASLDKDPVKEFKRRATVKRSNSLDSLTFRAQPQEVIRLRRTGWYLTSLGNVI